MVFKRNATNHITKRGFSNHIRIPCTAVKSKNTASDLLPELVKAFVFDSEAHRIDVSSGITLVETLRTIVCKS